LKTAAPFCVSCATLDAEEPAIMMAATIIFLACLFLVAFLHFIFPELLK